jgi:hypothetical protein
MDDPLSYVYRALLRGSFARPKGYKSRAEQQAEEMLAEQKRISEINEEAFQLWCDNLTPDKRAEYCEGVPRVKHSIRLREVFDQESD